MLGASIINTNSQLLTNSIGMLFGTGAILSLGGAIGIGFTKYSIHKDTIKVSQIKHKLNQNKLESNQVKIFYSINSVPRTLSYVLLIIGNGIIMIPMFSLFPDAILPAFIASSSVFGGATWYAMTRKTSELEIWGSTLYGGLTGIVGISLLGLGSNLIFGHNWFSDLSHVVSLYGGIPLFTGLVAYDTYKSIDKYQSGDPDHLGCSTELYLDFINLFVRFVEIMAKIQNAHDNANDHDNANEHDNVNKHD
jgi:FtsH-binding integral membrane protein